MSRFVMEGEVDGFGSREAPDDVTPSRTTGSRSAVSQLRRGRLTLVIVGAIVGATIGVVGLGRVDRASVESAVIVGLVVVMAAPGATLLVRGRRFPIVIGLFLGGLAVIGDRLLDDDPSAGAIPIVLWSAVVLAAAALHWRHVVVDGSVVVAPIVGPAAVATVAAGLGSAALAFDDLSSFASLVLLAAPLACVFYLGGQQLTNRADGLRPDGGRSVLVGAISGVAATAIASMWGGHTDLATSVGIALAALVALLILLVPIATIDGATVVVVASAAALAASAATGAVVLIALGCASALAIAVVYGLEPGLRMPTRRRLRGSDRADAAAFAAGGLSSAMATDDIDWTTLDADVEHASAEVDWSIVDKDLGEIVDGLDDGHDAAADQRDDHDAPERGETDDEVADDQVTDDEVADDQVTDDEVADDQVTDDEVADDQVADDQVTDDEVADVDETDDEVDEQHHGAKTARDDVSPASAGHAPARPGGMAPGETVPSRSSTRDAGVVASGRRHDQDWAGSDSVEVSTLFATGASDVVRPDVNGPRPASSRRLPHG